MSASTKRLKLSAGADDEVMLAPTPRQLRELWRFDNECAQKYMRVPLRNCSSIEPPDEPGTGLSQGMMLMLHDQIENMWRSLVGILEVFYDKSQPNLGYRLRVREDLPIRVTMRSADQIVVGWKAIFSDSCPSLHLYLRSDIKEKNQYLGGPVSYSNWAPTKTASLIVRQVSHGSAKHLVRGECKLVSGGCELMWDYGKRTLPQFSNEEWFQSKCCSITATLPKAVPYKSKIVQEVYRDLCVLCGKPYKAARRDWTKRRCQKKVHFLNSHATFLGTDWDGCGDYDPSKYNVDYNRALTEAERLNQLLNRLASDSWKTVPACVILKNEEVKTLTAEMCMKIFRKRCELMRKLGSIALRGGSVPSVVEHLQPIRPSRWDEIFPKGEQPKRKYSLPEHVMKEKKSYFEESLQQDLILAIGILEHSDSTAGDESSSESE